MDLEKTTKDLLKLVRDAKYYKEQGDKIMLEECITSINLHVQELGQVSAKIVNITKVIVGEVENIIR